MYLSVKIIFICSFRLRPVSSPALSAVTRSRVKKYSTTVSGRATMASTDMRVIHLPLSTPIMGMMTMGNTSATRMPDIMMAVIWLNTLRPPRAVVSRVERGTIKLWLMLKMV